MESLFDAWGKKNPEWEKKYAELLMEPFTDYGRGTSQYTVSRGKIFGAGYEMFIIGFFIASVTVFLKLAMDDMYKTADDIMKYTGLTNLAVVPKLGSFKGSGYGKTSSKKAQEEDA